MKYILIFLLMTILFACSTKQKEQLSSPNMLLILIDDMGWKDVGYAGSDYYQTPYIDRLAKEGCVFTNGYSNSPVCSPSRGAILTGLNPAATQFTCVFGNHVPLGDSLFAVSRNTGAKTNQYQEALHRHAVPRQTPMLVERLRKQGYRTGFFGKWHCGSGEGFLPDYRGFDVAKGYRPRHSSTKGHYIHSFNGNLAGLEQYDSTTYVSEALTTELIRFMEESGGAPFVGVLSHYLVHRPLQGLPELVRKFENRETDDQNIPEYAAMVASVDRSVGRVMQALDSLGLAENTLVVFTSDNGGLVPKSTSNYPLLGGKSYPFEAGMKVPFVVRWPGKIKANKTEERVLGSDIFPTFLEVAGLSAPDDPGRGRSFLPVLKGMPMKERPLVFHFPHYTHAASPFSSIIYQGWKLIRFYNDEEGRFLLYHLAADPYERVNLVGEMPVKVAELDALLQEELEQMQAEFPIENQNYLPGAAGNQNLKSSLELGEQERKLLENRLRSSGNHEKITSS
jgi:arylsulfatase A-like enzyme